MKFEEILPLINTLYTTIPLEEKRVLYDEASKVPDGGIIVDIGTCDGNSAFIMALANPKVEVWTIDPNPGKMFLPTRESLDLIERVHFIKEPSDNAIRDWKNLIDLLFIDGRHTEGNITSDINNWGSFVKPKAHILLHDYYWYTDMVQNAMEKADIKLKVLEVPYGLYDDKKVGIAITQKI